MVQVLLLKKMRQACIFYLTQLLADPNPNLKVFRLEKKKKKLLIKIKTRKTRNINAFFLAI